MDCLSKEERNVHKYKYITCLHTGSPCTLQHIHVKTLSPCNKYIHVKEKWTIPSGLYLNFNLCNFWVLWLRHKNKLTTSTLNVAPARQQHKPQGSSVVVRDSLPSCHISSYWAYPVTRRAGRWHPVETQSQSVTPNLILYLIVADCLIESGSPKRQQHTEDRKPYNEWPVSDFGSYAPYLALYWWPLQYL